MDMVIIFGCYECVNGCLDDMEVLDEINVCLVEIEVDIDGVKELWFFMFKNEIYNYLMEIELFGGAVICIGGVICDLLLGCLYVY